MSRVNLTARILAEERKATVEELRTLYQGLVCGCCPNATLYMSEGELQRLVGLVLYRRNVVELGKKRGRIIAKLAVICDRHPRTIRNWIKEAEMITTQANE